MVTLLFPLLKRFWFLYILMVVMIFGFKYFHSNAGVDGFEWILAPTARFVGILTGHMFEKESYIGYINHDLRFIIAPACSGVRYITIVFATLAFSFVHRMKTVKKGFCWMALSFGIAYIYTVFINGIRISLSIYRLGGQTVGSGWLGPEKLHLLEGTVIYLLALLFIYRIAGWATKKITDMPESKEYYIPPLFWYLAFTVAVPFIHRVYGNIGGAFTALAVFITVICGAAVILFCVMSFVWEIRYVQDPAGCLRQGDGSSVSKNVRQTNRPLILL